MIKIPNESKQFVQTNTSDNLGNLYATKNCDFDSNVGTIRLGKRLVLNTATADVPELNGPPAGFKYFNNGSSSNFYTIAGSAGVGYAFIGNAIDANFTKVTTSGAPATVDSATSDIEIFTDASNNPELHITGTDGKVYYLTTSNTWGNLTAGTSGSTAGTSMLCLYAGRMYVTKDGYKIQSYNHGHTPVSPNTGGTDGANTQAFTAILPNSDEVITFMKPTSTGIYIGALNTKGGKGHIYFWNGSDVQISSQFRLKAAGALSGTISGETLFVVDSNGAFGVMNGSTFTKLAEIWRKNNKPLFNPYNITNQRFIHPNGMSSIKGKISLLLDLTNFDVSNHNGTQEDTNPSGIWIYEEGSSASVTIPGQLRHKYSFGLSKSGGTIKDYGAFRIFSAGALSEILTASSPITNNGTFFAGCSYYTDATTTTSGIFYDDTNDTLAKSGYIVTPVFQAGASKTSLTDLWNKVYIAHNKYANATDKTIVKYRVYADTPVEGTITWVTTSSFTTTLDLSSYLNSGSLNADIEVEVLQGIGSGLCSHITALQAVSGGYMVTVDETYTGATGTSRARFSRWNKIGTIQDVEDFDEVSINTVSASMQVKIILFWTGQNEVNQIIMTNSVSKEVE